MKNYIIVLAALLAFTLTSCEKVINVDLKNAEPKIVIEGIVDNSGNPAKVIISKSVVFSANNSFPKVSGASVKITDNAGNVFTLNETTPGIYTNALLIGVIGKTYNLSVTVEGKIYTASSTMPRKAALDTLTQETIGSGTAGSAEKIVNLWYTDPIGFGDYILVGQSINGKPDDAIRVADDSYSDGSSSPFPVFGGEAELKTGDAVKIELRFIDKFVYRYMRGLADLQEGNTVPANPETNITGNPLGYFSAQTTETKTITIQ
jgi:Domain of unknown function (DUF4249)